jgi:NADH-quinone oxidoreductase subunit F
MDCSSLDNGRVISAFEEQVTKKDLKTTVDIRVTGCHGLCGKGPLVVIYPEEICYVEVKPKDVPDIISQTVLGKKVIDSLIYTNPDTGEKAAHLSEIPFYKNQMRHLMDMSTKIDPTSIDDYLAAGGYSALSKSLFEMSSEQVLEEIKKAELRGRGGGGFPAGRKWETARNAPGKEKYVIVNAHEGELGAFMDRAIFTGNPHSVLEGLIIGAYAIGSKQGFYFLKGKEKTVSLRKKLSSGLPSLPSNGDAESKTNRRSFFSEKSFIIILTLFINGQSDHRLRPRRRPVPRDLGRAPLHVP